MTDRSLDRIQTVFHWLSIAILVASFVFAGLWVYNASFNLEPLLAFLGLFYSVVALLGNWITKQLEKRVKEEELSIAYALAHGYMYNYLAPVVRGLRKRLPDPSGMVFIVYIPKNLDEFRSHSIDEVITELSNRQYVVDTVELLFENEKRKMDYRTAKRSEGGTIQYFDFPTTLLTLDKVIAYKMNTNKDSRPDKEIERLSEQYISNFKEQLLAILQLQEFDAIRGNIKIVSSGRFDFLESNDTPAS
ncbi:STING domain-containing protein [Flagellimonas amoyensis]|uniref:STING domain-containing protein n=1 Tax=Flagellimonas amoyensis TaxID=2169401 RepID=UPI000D39AA1E|nr:STING domain-containing protein [Allomuricauda amoyensis]